MGNIATETAPDPWPKHGLVAKYKPFILKRAKEFHEYNPHLRWEEVVTDAIRLTWEASQRFKPELGYDFSTYLRHRLRGGLLDLNGIKRNDKLEPDILKTEPVRFLGAGNGARLVLDTGPLVVGARMVGNNLDYLKGVLNRIRADMPVMNELRDHEHAGALLRAIVDHAERREREAISEAEQGGVVLLETRDLRADVRFYKNDRLFRFKPVLAIEDRGESLDEGIGWHQIFYAPQSKGVGRPKRSPKTYTKPDVPAGAWDDDAWELDQFAKYADLTDKEQIALSFMRTSAGRQDSEIAEFVGVSQGYYSKMKLRIIEKLREGRKVFHELEQEK